MRLADNPLIRSQIRDQWRGFGKPLMLAALAAAAGLFLLFGVSLDERAVWLPFEAARRAAAAEYLPGLAVVQAIGFVVGVPALVAWTIASHRRSGVLEANRLTSLSSRELLLGYWIGPAVLLMAATVLLGAAGGGLVVIGGLDIAGPAWLQWQIGVASSGLLAGLLAAIIGLTTASRGAFAAVGLIAASALAVSSDTHEFSAAHLLAGTHLADELHRLLDDGGSREMMHNVFGVDVPTLILTLLAQLTMMAGAWFGGERAVEASRGTRGAADRNVFVWLGALAGFALLQFGLLFEAFTVRSELDPPSYWGYHARGASQGLLSLWLTVTFAGAAYGMSRVADPVSRYREALRQRLGGPASTQPSPYYALGVFAVALGGLHMVVASFRDPAVLTSVDFDVGQGMLATLALLSSWFLVTLTYELTVQKFGRRAPAWLALILAVTFGATLIAISIIGDEQLIVGLPGLLPVYLATEGTGDGDVIATVGAAQALALGLLTALRLHRHSVAADPQEVPVD